MDNGGWSRDVLHCLGVFGPSLSIPVFSLPTCWIAEFVDDGWWSSDVLHCLGAFGPSLSTCWIAEFVDNGCWSSDVLHCLGVFDPVMSRVTYSESLASSEWCITWLLTGVFGVALLFSGVAEFMDDSGWSRDVLHCLGVFGPSVAFPVFSVAPCCFAMAVLHGNKKTSW